MSVKHIRFVVRGCARFLAAAAESRETGLEGGAGLLVPARGIDCVEQCLERLCRAHMVCGTLVVSGLRGSPAIISEDEAAEIRADLAVAMTSACGMLSRDPLRVYRACLGALNGFVPGMLPHPPRPEAAGADRAAAGDRDDDVDDDGAGAGWREGAGSRRLGAGGMVASLLSAAQSSWHSRGAAGAAAAGVPGAAVGDDAALALLRVAVVTIDHLTAPATASSLRASDPQSLQLELTRLASMADMVRCAAACKAAELVASASAPSALLLPCLRLGIASAARARAADASVYTAFAAALRMACPSLAAAADRQLASVAEAAADPRLAWRLSLAAASEPRSAMDDAAAASALHDAVSVRREVFALAAAPPRAESRIDTAIATITKSSSFSSSSAGPAVTAPADLVRLGALRAAAGASRARIATLPCDAWQPSTTPAAAETQAQAAALMGVWRARPGQTLPAPTARAAVRAADAVMASGSESVAGRWLAKAVAATVRSNGF
jgi:hypothetical protein